MIRRAEHAPVVAAIRDSAPSGPGVYVFRAQDGQIIYIGKSVHLRDRMLSYFYEDLTKVESRIARMITAIADYECHVTETELLALLLEDELIKRHRPPYNVKQRDYTENCYLWLSGDEFPTCRRTERIGDRHGGALYGPFKDRYYVDRLIELLQRTTQVRTCPESQPTRVCELYELNRCVGPCRPGFAAERYESVATRVREFLSGDSTRVVEQLSRAMHEHAVAQKFESAARAKADRDFCEHFCTRQRFLSRFKTRKLTITERTPKPMKYLFRQGRLVDYAPDGTLEEAISAATTQEDERFVIDRGHIVFSWLRRREGDVEWSFGE